MSRIHRRIFAVICVGYLLLATIYSVTTPIFEASDELWHYPMVQTLATNGLSLPVQNPAQTTAWRQEGSQPPLYYLIAAVLTVGIDTSDMEFVRRVNPHADIGIVRPDGNVNMIVHRPGAETLPYGATVLAVHIVRWFSVLLGLGTVICTALIARELFPGQPVIFLGAAALNAFLPMFLFISGSVNNDNLSNFLGNLLTLLIVRLIKFQSRPPIRVYVWIGIVTGLGLLAKLNIGFLIPVVALALMVVSIRTRNLRPLVIGGLISGTLTIAIAGWWYVRNAQLYGDPTGLNVFLDIVGRRAIPANAAQLWAERHSFTQAFWGFFGGVNVPMPTVIYNWFDLIGIIGIIGAIVFLIRQAIRRIWDVNRWLTAAVTLLWIAVTFLSYLRWTAETPASQGRLIFGALASLCVWLVVGLTWWLPRRAKAPIMTVIAGTFAVVAAAAPFAFIAPAYRSPDHMLIAPTADIPLREPDGTPILRLKYGEVMTERAAPDSYVEIALHWQAESTPTRDWSLFVHLVTPDGVIISQRDINPGNGTLATSDQASGDTWTDRLAVYVPPAAYAPMTLDVVLGWYDLTTGERLSIAGSPDTTIPIGTVELVPRPSPDDTPNPLSVNFGGMIELFGYALTDLTPRVGDTVELTLYWRGLQTIAENYVVFAHIIDPATLTIYAGSDAQPAAWTAPTSTWNVGDPVIDTHTLTINPDAPPGIYELEIGLYVQRGERFERLRVVTADGGMANDFTYLSRVRILPQNADAP